jgi:hypothetical protein
MSKLYDIRQALADSIAEAGIVPADAIVIKRQTDLWNDVALAVNASQDSICLHIGIAAGDATEPDELEMEVTVPLTLIVPPSIVDGATPEEDVWEALVKHVHDLRLNESDHYAYRFRFKSFADQTIEADDGTAYLGRQTVFAYKLSL